MLSRVPEHGAVMRRAEGVHVSGERPSGVSYSGVGPALRVCTSTVGINYSTLKQKHTENEGTRRSIGGGGVTRDL